MAKQGQPPSRKLEAREVESIKRELSQKKDMLRATTNFGEGSYSPAAPEEVSINREKLQSSVRELEKVLETQAPERASRDAERHKIVKRREELQRMFMPLLETQRDIDVMKNDSPEYRAAFSKATQRHKIEPLISEWKELGKRLDPDDPTLISLDSIRLSH